MLSSYALGIISISISPEEAVSEVKRQALSELQKAIATAEQRAGELLAQERSKMARELDEARRKAREEVLREWNRQEEGQEVSV